MSDASPATKESRPAPPLNEVMLAMDVVDTLRAHRELVARELDGEARARSFADRIKSIYASQGIDVPDTVIQEAVEALEQDRFTYRPPARTFAVRMAEVYVNRGTWFRRLGALLVVLALVWGGIAWSKNRRDRGLEEAFAARQGLLTRDVDTTSARIETLRSRIREVGRQAQPGTVVAGLTAQATALLGDIEQRFDALTTDAAPLDAEAYPDDQPRMDARLEARRRAVGEIQNDLGRVAGQLDGIRRLQGLRGRITVILARLGGLNLTPAQQADIDRLRHQAGAALETGDAQAAEARVSELQSAVAALAGAMETRRRLDAALAAAAADLDGMQLATDTKSDADQLRARVRAALDTGDLNAANAHLAELTKLARVVGTAYELRIISRPGLQSGVWRIPDDRPDVRNYYVLVEPIGADGRPVSIPVRNEENQTTVMVTRLGIRVPETVFEAIKRDKMDNGIVDQNVFGVKRRGRMKPEYRYETAGGWITDW